MDNENQESLKSAQHNYSDGDRRKAQRIRGILVNFRRQGDMGNYQGVFLRDMSAQGVSFTASEKLEVEDGIEMLIYLTDTKNPVQADGEVRWSSESSYLQGGKKTYYDVGVKITRMEEAAVRLLENYMKLHEKDQ